MRSSLYDPLSRDEIHQIDLATMEVLERTGVLVENDAALNLLGEAGAKIDKNRRIAKIPEYVEKDGLKKAPSSFVLFTRKGNRIKIGGDRTVISSGAGATWTLDLETGEPRASTKKDVEEMSRLTDALEHMELCMAEAIPHDVKSTVVDVHAAEAVMCNTIKPAWMCPGDGNQARYIIEMAAVIAGGIDELRKKPILMGSASPNSPLRLAPKDIDVVYEFAEHKLPTHIVNCSIVGATSPISLAGTLVTSFAELLSMTLLVQLINPGTPVVVGMCPACMDMRTANPSFGAPEEALLAAANVQLLRYYNIPSYNCPAETDAIIPDAQAGYETAWTVLLPFMAGVSLINGVGHLGTSTGASFEKLVIDNEIFGAVRRIIQGVNVSENSLAVEVIDAVGPAGHFLSQKHTRENFQREVWCPRISNRVGVEQWKKTRDDLWAKARQEAIEILRTHKPEPLDKETEERVKNLTKEAERAIIRT